MTARDTEEAGAFAETNLPLPRLAKLWAAGTGLAILLVASSYLIAQTLADPLVVAGTGEVTLDELAGFTVFGATVGAAVAVGIGRLSRRPRPTFLAVTMIALAGYAVVPFRATESIATALWLNLFHLVVAVPVIGMLARWLPADRTSAHA